MVNHSFENLQPQSLRLHFLLVASVLLHVVMLAQFSMPDFSGGAALKAPMVEISLNISANNNADIPAAKQANAIADKAENLPDRSLSEATMEQASSNTKQPTHAEQAPVSVVEEMLLTTNAEQQIAQAVETKQANSEAVIQTGDRPTATEQQAIENRVKQETKQPTQKENIDLPSLSDAIAPTEPVNSEPNSQSSSGIETQLTAVNTAQMISTQPPAESSSYFAANYAGSRPTVLVPALAKKKRLRGQVIVRGRIDEQGQLQQGFIYQSSGHDILDDSALKQAQQWRFQPAIKQGQPIAQWVQIPIVF